METCPAEILQEIFALACTDTGYTGRSLSLVSKYIHDISGPFKYQSLAITQWRQMTTFLQTFSQLPDSQKKIKYLFVHCPYLLAGVEDNLRPGDSSPIDSSEDSPFDSDMTDEVAGESDDISESESVSDSEFERSLNSEDERELLEDAKYLQAVRNGSQLPEGNTRDDALRDAEIQSFFDNTLETFRAILNETSSTLTVLGVYWAWKESHHPPIHRLLPPMPRLQELHLYRRGFSQTEKEYENPPTTIPFPLLRFLYLSGDCPRAISFKDLARLAPNLTHLRFPNNYFRTGSQNSAHSFNFHVGGIIVEDGMIIDCAEYEELKYLWTPEKTIRNQLGISAQIAIEHIEKGPKAWHWHRWWASRVAGEIGPWGALGTNN